MFQRPYSHPLPQFPERFQTSYTIASLSIMGDISYRGGREIDRCNMYIHVRVVIYTMRRNLLLLAQV